MKYGIYGCEHNHIAIFMQEMRELGHTCVGIYEPSAGELAGQLCDLYQAPRLDSAEALCEAGAEVIGSSAINNDKIGIIEWSEAHGLPVMVDKPAVTDEAQLARLLAVMERGRIAIGMLLTERFHPAIVALKRQLVEGAIGELVAVQMRKPHRLAQAKRPAWFYSRERSGGIIVDLLVHDVDLLHWLTGSAPIARQAHLLKRILPEHPTFYDAASLQLLYESGVTAQLYADWHTPDSCWTWGDGRIVLTGTRGVLEARLGGIGPEDATPSVTRMTHEQGLTSIALELPGRTITEDFLCRLAGEESIIDHQAIAVAMQEAIAADACALTLAVMSR